MKLFTLALAATLTFALSALAAPSVNYTNTVPNLLVRTQAQVIGTLSANALRLAGQTNVFSDNGVKPTYNGVPIVTNNGVAQSASRGAINAARSLAAAQAAYTTGNSFVELWANTNAWTFPATPGMVISNAFLYSTGAAGGINGANHSYALAAKPFTRTVYSLVYNAASGGGGLIFGFSTDSAGAVPTGAAAKCLGLFLSSAAQVPRIWNLGTSTDIGVANTLVKTYTVTCTSDSQWLSVVAAATDGSVEYRARFGAATNTIGNLYLFNSDTRALSGNYFKHLAARDPIATSITRTGIEGLGRTVSWSGDGTSTWTIRLPATYDSRVPSPVCVVFHGNGADENYWADNGNYNALTIALNNAGYIVLSAAAANLSSWGTDAGQAAYSAAYDYLRAHYATGPVVLFGVSMGALESLLVLANDSIPGVVAWAATSPAVSLYNNYTNGFGAVIDTAYGIAGDYDAKTAGHDPLLLDPSRFKSVPMRVVVASDDATVDPAANTDALETRLSQHNEFTKVTTTGGHSFNIAAFVAGLVSFYDRFTAPSTQTYSDTVNADSGAFATSLTVGGNAVLTTADTNTVVLMSTNSAKSYADATFAPLANPTFTGTINGDAMTLSGMLAVDALALPLTEGHVKMQITGGTTNLVNVDATEEAIMGKIATNTVTGTGTFPLSSVTDALTNAAWGTIGASIDGGGSALVANTKAFIEIPYSCKIYGWTLIGSPAGAAVVNVWKCSYSDFDGGSTHPVVGDKITASAPPTITATATKGQGTASDLSTWGSGTNITAGEIIAFNVDSCTTMTNVTLTLKVLK